MRHIPTISNPKKLFLVSFILTLIIINIDDVLYDGVPSLPGMIFLCQSVALVVTAAATVYLVKWRARSPSWITAGLSTIVIMLFSFYMFHYGPRIVTEADGPAAIGYACEEAESDETVVAITGDYFGPFAANNLNTNLCLLRNIPLGASNLIPSLRDYNNDGMDTFLIFEVIIGIAFVAPIALKRFSAD